jgi:hypothetical protein
MDETHFSEVLPEFIAKSSPLASVVALYNPAGLTNPAFTEGGLRLLSVLGSCGAPVPERMDRVRLRQPAGID